MACVLTIPIFTGLSRPPSGGQHRTKALVEQLKRLGHATVVLESGMFYEDADAELARIYCYDELRLLGLSLGLLRDFNPSFLLAVMKTLRQNQVDFVQISHPSGVVALRIAQILLGNAAPIIYDAYNVDFEVMRETLLRDSRYPWLIRRAAVAYNRLLEEVLVRWFARAILTVSKRDASIFSEDYGVPASKIHVIPSGCHILPPADAAEKKKAREELGIPPGKTVIVFHGLFNYLPNREAFRLIETEIAPQIERLFPDAMFVLAGTDAPHMERRNVKSIGFVSDLYKFLACADIAIVPIVHGSGTRLKILDYLSVGLPIVATSKGAEGLELKNGTHALLVDDAPDSVVAGLERLLANRDWWRDLAHNARQLAEEKYDWNVIGQKLDEFYRNLGSLDL